MTACTLAGSPADTTGWEETSADVTDGGTTLPTETSPEGNTDVATTEAPTEGNDDPTISATTRPAQEVKVISMNLDANETTAASRVRRMAPLLLSFEPDSIGVQECRGGWVNLLKKHFISEGYARVGVDAGGNVDSTGGYFATYILYKEDKFNLIDSGTFWLSQTPEVPSIYGPTVDCNRTCTWALLEDKVTGFRYVHMNCHLDWMDMSVNKIQVEMIREQIERFEAMGYPVFAGGDYNCDEGTGSYYAMLESDVIADSKKVAAVANDIATYPSYGEYDVYDPSQRPIDYFFVTKDKMTVKEYRVVDEKPDGQYISDHFPVFVHALVHETDILPAEDTIPTFADPEAVKADLSTPNAVSITFPQAKSAQGVTAYEYHLEFYLGTKRVTTATIPSGILRLNTPDQVVYPLMGMTESGDYTAKLTPVGMLGETGETVTVAFSFTYQVESAQMPAADILDIRITSDGPVDSSLNAYEIVAKGSTAIVETEYGTGLDFNKQSNYKISGITNHYIALEKGFTMEVYFTTGEDITTFQSLVSNMHAGGFGVDWEKGELTFSVRVGGSYVGPSVPIESNTTYHIVGVYTGKRVLLYVNGALAGDQTVSGTLNHPTDNGAKYLCIGADSDATGNGEYPIDATVYLVRMYTDVATEGQALYLYEQISRN